MTEQLTLQQVESMSSRDLIDAGYEKERTELIDLEAIFDEEFLVDPTHSDNLGKSILEKRGQITPITVRVRVEDGQLVYDIADGFHRTRSLKRIRKEFNSWGPLVATALQKKSHITDKGGVDTSGWKHTEIAHLVNDGVLSIDVLRSIVEQDESADDIPLSDSAAEEIRDWVHTFQNLQAKAVVMYSCSDEELYDLRVLAASSVRTIRFARMASWMTQSFESARWGNTRIHKLIESGDLTLSQVISLASQDTSGIKLGLAGDEAEELKDWIIRKSEYWDRPLSTLLQEMRTVEAAAPDLVQMVRKSGGGKGGRGVLNHARLSSIVKHAPGEWEVQRLAVAYVLDRNVLAKEIGNFVKVLRENLVDDELMKREGIEESEHDELRKQWGIAGDIIAIANKQGLLSEVASELVELVPPLHHDATKWIWNMVEEKQYDLEDIAFLAFIYRNAFETGDQETLEKVMRDPDFYIHTPPPPVSVEPEQPILDIPAPWDESEAVEGESASSSTEIAGEGSSSRPKWVTSRMSRSERRSSMASRHKHMRTIATFAIDLIAVSQEHSILRNDDYGDIRVNGKESSVMVNGKVVKLSTRELRLMTILTLLADEVVEESFLIEMLQIDTDNDPREVLESTVAGLKEQLPFVDQRLQDYEGYYSMRILND